jgi:SAM-dependent methyltransferase
MNSNLLGNLSNILESYSGGYNSPALSNIQAEAKKKADMLEAAKKANPDMNPLVPFFDPNYTDKDTVHSYLPVYAHLLRNAWGKPFRMLEIGIQRGGSLLAWCKAFPQATVYGVDCQKTVEIKAPNYKEKILNAYSEEMLQAFAHEELFDFIVEDGSHAYNDILFACHYYHKFLKPGGVLVIEDVPDIKWLPKMKAITSATGCTHEVVDLREKKKRWDDVLFIIKKPNV